jgi:hypothetical protein
MARRYVFNGGGSRRENDHLVIVRGVKAMYYLKRLHQLPQIVPCPTLRVRIMKPGSSI